MKSSKIFAISYLIIIIVLNVVSYFYLPEDLVMQITSGGEDGFTLPKMVGLALLLALGAMTGLKLLVSKTETDDKRWYPAMAIILIVNIIVIVFNL
ncbi:MAG: hypothetical protein JXB20_03565 [Bacilli bacterium]|nr:hypothetical protein [Bacilli bacterium]